MACGDVGTTQAVSPLRQDAELEQRVAHHTGVGRASRAVFVDEILYDGAAEALALVGHVVLDAHTLGQTACLHRLVAPHPHGEPHNLVALLAQHQARSGAVYAAAHAHQNSLFRYVHKLLFLLYGKQRYCFLPILPHAPPTKWPKRCRRKPRRRPEHGGGASGRSRIGQPPSEAGGWAAACRRYVERHDTCNRRHSQDSPYRKL